MFVFPFVQDLSAITPKRYESKTVTTKGMGKVKRKAAVDTNPVTTALKKPRGWGIRFCVGDVDFELHYLGRERFRVEVYLMVIHWSILTIKLV